MAAQQSLHGQVATLNEHLDEFNQFVAEYGYDDEFHPIHFVGSPDPQQAEQATIDHWDEFLQFSRHILNADAVPRNAALGHIDSINLDYKRVLTAAQEQSI